ncbi:MAG: hypothetical protein LBV45_04420 [Xanthomonadaceae bacterium]|nr:hypothetical protein [Xanthomonadaceae bacterium]
MAADTSLVDDPSHIPASQQRIIVITADWNANQGFLYRYERTGAGEWHAMGAPIAVSIGRKGSAWGTGLHPPQIQEPRKQEGDGRSPAGIFAIGTAFGYAASADTAMPYQAMRNTHYCIDVPDSPLYNRIVDADEAGSAAVAGSTEPMRLDLRRAGDSRYRLGLVIEHNPERIPGGGSCIFVHLRRHPSETTAGCTSMDETDMHRLLHWLQPDAHPQFILLPRPQYDRWRTAWELPELDNGGQ